MRQNLSAYIGPETILPAVSIAAAIAGLALTFLHFLLAPFKKLVSAIKGESASIPTPAAMQAEAETLSCDTASTKEAVRNPGRQIAMPSPPALMELESR